MRTSGKSRQTRIRFTIVMLPSFHDELPLNPSPLLTLIKARLYNRLLTGRRKSFIIPVEVFMTDMASGTVRLKGRALLEKSELSIYQLAKDAGVSYPAMHKYITDPGSIKQLSGEVLYGILTSIGLSLDEISQVPLGEIFELVPHNGNGSATE